MPDFQIGNLVYKIAVQGAQKADQQVGKLRGRFGGMAASAKKSAMEIPGISSALRLMTNPVALATGAVVALGAALTASVNKVRNLEKELRPMVQRSGIAAESLQVLTKAAERLGSEDGLEGVTDSSQELQLRMAEAVAGSDAMAKRFTALGLSAEELAAKSPEEAFLAVISALQGVNDEAQRKFLADELMGGSSEKLAGIINASSLEFQQLTADIRENGGILSGEGLESARRFNEQWANMQGQISGVMIAIGSALMPALTALMQALNDLKPVIKAIGPILISLVKTPLELVGGAVRLIVSLLKGDWRGAWQAARDIAATMMRHLITIYNNTLGRIPGFAKVDMAQVEAAIRGVRDEADATGTAMTEMATDTREATEALKEQKLVLGEERDLVREAQGAIDDHNDSLEIYIKHKERQAQVSRENMLAMAKESQGMRLLNLEMLEAMKNTARFSMEGEEMEETALALGQEIQAITLRIQEYAAALRDMYATTPDPDTPPPPDPVPDPTGNGNGGGSTGGGGGGTGRGGGPPIDHTPGGSGSAGQPVPPGGWGNIWQSTSFGDQAHRWNLEAAYAAWLYREGRGPFAATGKLPPSYRSGIRYMGMNSNWKQDYESIFGRPVLGMGGLAMRPTPAVVGDVPEAIIPLSQLGRIMGGRGGGAGTTYEVHGDAFVVEGSQLSQVVGEAELMSDRRGRQQVLR